MNSENTSNASASATTSRNAPPKPPKSEADFLAQQAEAANAAMSRVLEEIKSNLKTSADVRLWTRDYPLVAVGSAALAGFIAAYAAVPSQEQQAAKRLAKIERTLAPQTTLDGTSNPPPKPTETLMSTLGKTLLSTLQPALLSILTSSIAARTNPDQDEHEMNR